MQREDTMIALPSQQVIEAFLRSEFKPQPRATWLGRFLLGEPREYRYRVLDVAPYRGGLYSRNPVILVRVDDSFLQRKFLPGRMSEGIFWWNGESLRYLNRNPEQLAALFNTQQPLDAVPLDNLVNLVADTLLAGPGERAFPAGSIFELDRLVTVHRRTVLDPHEVLLVENVLESPRLEGSPETGWHLTLTCVRGPRFKLQNIVRSHVRLSPEGELTVRDEVVTAKPFAFYGFDRLHRKAA